MDFTEGFKELIITKTCFFENLIENANIHSALSRSDLKRDLYIQLFSSLFYNLQDTGAQ